MNTEPGAPRATPLIRIIDAALEHASGWLSFDRFMAMALYAPGVGYYANQSRKFGRMPTSGSDFVTAPELSPLFGRTLARQVDEALSKTGTDAVWEFGAGSGALAKQLLDALGERVSRYAIVDLSGTLRERQQVELEAYRDKVEWLDALPDTMEGVVIGNEVLDAMPVRLLVRIGGQWMERGVVRRGDGPAFGWEDRPTDLRPPIRDRRRPRLPHGNPSAGRRLHRDAGGSVAPRRGLLPGLWVSGVGVLPPAALHGHGHVPPRAPERRDPLADVGSKDITAHVDFTAVALAGQDAACRCWGTRPRRGSCSTPASHR